MARDFITAFAIGNNSGVKTLLEVGADFALLEELQKTESQLAEMVENKRKLTQSFVKYQQGADHGKNAGDREDALLIKLKAAVAKFDQQIKLLEERKKIVVANVYEFKHSYIKIEHSALSGTVFKIGSRLFQVKEEIVGPKTVRLVDEEIKVF